ncbi:hypothetical protein [Streptomyces sp. NPDC003374]
MTDNVLEPDSSQAPDTAAEAANKNRRRGRDRRPDRAGLFTAAAVFAACGGLVLYGVLTSKDNDAPDKHPVAAAPVTYEVAGTGTAEITFQSRSGSGKATVVKNATLPWRTTVDVPLGQTPIVSIVLGEEGGQARCSLAVRGRHVQSATASGGFGRATCTGSLPGPNPAATAADG